MKNRKQSGSIRAFFTDFMKNHLGKNPDGRTSKYGREKIVDEVFYVGDPSKNRSLLSDYEENLSSNPTADFLRSEADDQETINLINDYISRLDLRKEENRFRLKALMIIFLMRDFRNKYYKLKMKQEYADLLKNTYIEIYRAKYSIYYELCKTIKGIAKGEITKVPKVSTNPKDLVNHFMRNNLTIDPEFMLNPAVDVDKMEVKSNIDDTLQELGLSILNERRERIITENMFPYLDTKQLRLISDTIFVYRSVWNKFHPKVNANILTIAIGISDSAKDKYKSIVSNELVKLANQNSYEDITPYLLDEDEPSEIISNE